MKRIIFLWIGLANLFIIQGQEVEQLLVPNSLDSRELLDSIQRILSQKEDSIARTQLISKTEKDSLLEREPVFIPPLYEKAEGSFTVAEVPDPKKAEANGYISDPSDFLSAADEQELNSLIWRIEQKTTAQIAIVLLPGIGSEVPKDFAVDLFEYWGIGQSDKDNGLLILTIMDQRRTEFEVGYGLEPILSDIVCFNIGLNHIVPNFKKGAYGEGLKESLIKIEEFLTAPEAIEEIYATGINYDIQEYKDEPGLWYYILLIYAALCVLVGLGYFVVFFDIDLAKDDFYDKYKRLDSLKYLGLVFLMPLPFIFFNILIRKRKKKFRYAPRFSRENGKPMTLLNAWAENKFLEEAQILEEKIKSVSYDVWATEDRSDILILEYDDQNSRKYSKCTSCNYKTYGRTKSTVVEAATYSSKGYGYHHYQCKNCNYSNKVKYTIPQKQRSTSSSGSSGSSFSSSSSSSSWGGGSSGGGGAGVSW